MKPFLVLAQAALWVLLFLTVVGVIGSCAA